MRVTAVYFQENMDNFCLYANDPPLLLFICSAGMPQHSHSRLGNRRFDAEILFPATWAVIGWGGESMTG